MPYVGNSPAANFASVTKDEFSGDGSTDAFTLSKAATTNGVAVFVENVRQEPTTAYSVSGTTLTFTAAPVSASGNNIYVLHHNAPASTATHPAGQDLTAANATVTGTLSVTGATTVGGTSDLTITDGNLVVGTSGHGIDFSATSDASGKDNELLDDYEEGTWTASITTASGSVTLNSAADLCTYVKIGRLVHVNGSIVVTSVSSPSGAAKIAGFPFALVTGDSENSERVGFYVLHDSLTGLGDGSNAVSGQVYAADSTAQIYTQESGGVVDMGNHIQANTTLIFSFSYPV